MKDILIFDIGGTFVKWALMDESYNIKERGEFVTFEEDNDTKTEALYDNLCRMINEYKDNIVGVGISSACVYDEITGKFMSQNSTFNRYYGFAARDYIKDRTGFDPVIMNDANSGTLGEVKFGSLQGTEEAVMIVIGTGIGGGIVSKGKPFTGNKGNAGEVGFMIIEGQHWEEVCSARVLAKDISEELGKEVDGRWIFSNLENEVVKKHYKIFNKRLATGLVNIWNTTGPEKICIGGGIVQNENFDLQLIYDEIKPLVYPPVFDVFKLEKAKLGNDANLLGVASILRERIN